MFCSNKSASIVCPPPGLLFFCCDARKVRRGAAALVLSSTVESVVNLSLSLCVCEVVLDIRQCGETPSSKASTHKPQHRAMPCVCSGQGAKWKHTFVYHPQSGTAYLEMDKLRAPGGISMPSAVHTGTVQQRRPTLSTQEVADDTPRRPEASQAPSHYGSFRSMLHTDAERPYTPQSPDHSQGRDEQKPPATWAQHSPADAAHSRRHLGACLHHSRQS